MLNDGAFAEDGSYTENGETKTAWQWTPIGNSDNRYKGTFDGQGNTIKGLYVNVIASNYYANVGLFGYADNATIQNVTVDGYVSVSGVASGKGTSAGGIVGFALDTKLEGCTNLCTVKSACSAAILSLAGGIAGVIKASDDDNRCGSVTNCRNGGKVILTANYDYDSLNVGGIAGASSVPVSSCYNTGAIEASSSKENWGSFSAGGVVGNSTENVYNCYNTGAVTVRVSFTITNNYSACFGGVVGYAMDYVSNCYNTGKVTSSKGYVGGVAGLNWSTGITKCYYLSDTAADGVGNTFGGSAATESITDAKSKSDFASGAVLALLKQGDANAWGDNGYLAAAGMTLPLLKNQTADAHDHAYVQTHNDTEHWQECDCGKIISKAAHSFTENTDAKYLKTSATCTDKAVYYKSCADCGVKSTETFTSGNPLGHTGGTATCTNKAKCDVCGAQYGEVDANYHTDLKHIDAKAATKTDEGNIEYWYCEGCVKYFADAAATKEIAKTDTVTAKLPEEKPTSPATGDTSHLALWIVLLFIIGGAVTVTTVVIKKKKHSR